MNNPIPGLDPVYVLPHRRCWKLVDQLPPGSMMVSQHVLIILWSGAVQEPFGQLWRDGDDWYQVLSLGVEGMYGSWKAGVYRLVPDHQEQIT